MSFGSFNCDIESNEQVWKISEIQAAQAPKNKHPNKNAEIEHLKLASKKVMQ